MLAALLQATRTAAAVFTVLIGALLFGYFLTITQTPQKLTEFLTGLGVGRYGVLALIMLMYLVLGCLMDAMAMIILTVPIIFPVVTALGFDPIWFGIIIVMTVELGLIHPPVGMNVFVIKTVVQGRELHHDLQGRAAVRRDRHRASGDPDRFPDPSRCGCRTTCSCAHRERTEARRSGAARFCIRQRQPSVPSTVHPQCGHRGHQRPSVPRDGEIHDAGKHDTCAVCDLLCRRQHASARSSMGMPNLGQHSAEQRRQHHALTVAEHRERQHQQGHRRVHSCSCQNCDAGQLRCPAQCNLRSAPSAA